MITRDDDMNALSTEHFALRYWPERDEYYVINRATEHQVGPFFRDSMAAARWATRIQDDYDHGRTLGIRA